MKIGCKASKLAIKIKILKRNYESDKRVDIYRKVANVEIEPKTFALLARRSNQLS